MDRIKAKNNGNLIIYKDSVKKTRALFKNKPMVQKKIKTVLVNIGHNTFIAVPSKTYNKLESIETYYTNCQLFEWSQDDDEWVESIKWNHVLHNPQEIVRFYNNMRHRADTFSIDMPVIWWDSLFEIRYKKVKFKTKDGKRHKMGFNKFARKYLKGIQIY